jgi:hypothetical protein
VTDNLIPVRMRDCSCPGQPHAEGDFAYLKPKADLTVGLTAHAVLMLGITDAAEMIGALGRAYTISGVARWDLLDEHGKPVPVSTDAIDKLSWTDIAEVADKASDLYSNEVMLPLRDRLLKSSPNGRTPKRTSATRASSKSRRKR